MKERILLGLLVLAFAISGCSSSNMSGVSEPDAAQASLDLVNVKDDKVKVTVTAPQQIESETISFQLPRIIPGTYAIADYGRYIEDFNAYDNSGNKLSVFRKDTNTWVISGASDLAKVTYLVNDTYDSEQGGAFSEGAHTIFSPAGTNILAGKQFMLNMGGFVGYFTDKKQLPYKIAIIHPQNLQSSTALIDENPAMNADAFTVSRYADLVDNPIMYSEPDITTSKIGNMDVLLSVYSPRKKEINAQALYPDLEKMVRAQKNYLGDINKTKKYAVLTYITTGAKDDAKGIGALEHNSSTTAIFMESMTSKDLIHVISHEFFHTLTPLNVHSEEIQDFDFNEPKLSRHLWMYEGFTEYFSQHFQVHEGLMTEEDFLTQLATKEKTSKLFNDSLSFTEMSMNVIDEKMKAQYPNVYEKGALMAMCLDIIIRDNSNGEKGILNMMGELSKKYGPDKPFKDAELIPEITKMTYPEVGDFLQKHVVEGVPVDYAEYLKRVGVERAVVKEPTQLVLIIGTTPYIRIDTVERKVTAVINDDANNFVNALGIKNGDEIIEWNGQPIDASTLMGALMTTYGIQEGAYTTIRVKRNGEMIELSGNAKLNYIDGSGYKFADPSKMKLKEAWLKG